MPGPFPRAGLLWPLAAIGLVALLGVRSMQAPERAGEGALTADGFLRSLGNADGAAGALTPDGVGATHVALYATLTRAFDRYDSLVTAGRELFLVAALGVAVLLWRTARRFGLSDPAAAAVVVLAAVPALAPPLALFDVPAALAVPWLVLAGFLTVSGRATRAAEVGALLAGAVAVLLAPVVVLLALSGAAASLLLTSTARRAPRALLALVPVAVFLVVAVLLREWEPAGATAAIRGVPDAAEVVGAIVFLVLAGVAAWLSPALRCPAIALGATTVATLGSALLLDVLLVGLPIAAVLATVLAAERLGSAVRTPRRRAVACAAVGILAVGACVAAVVTWPAAAAAPTGGVAGELLRWAGAELPQGARLLAPRRLRAELLHAGADEDQVPSTAPSARTDPSTPVLTVTDGKLPESGVVLARILRPGAEPPVVVVDPAPGVPTPEELSLRRSLAAAILVNPRTSVEPEAAGVLRSAAVDQRLLSLLAAMTAQSGVGIASFPAPPAEPDGLLARHALVETAGGEDLRPGAAATERVVTWLEAQRGPFAPDSVDGTDRGVLIGFRYVSDPDALVSAATP